MTELRAVAFARSGDQEFPPARVPVGWRGKRLLAPARVEIMRGELVNLDDPAVRAELERRHAGFFHRHGMDHLDVSQIRSREREVTQHIARFLYLRGAAVLAFGSNLDNLPSYALFDERSRLIPDGDPELLTSSLPEFLVVCREFGLAAGD